MYWPQLLDWAVGVMKMVSFILFILLNLGRNKDKSRMYPIYGSMLWTKCMQFYIDFCVRFEEVHKIPSSIIFPFIFAITCSLTQPSRVFFTSWGLQEYFLWFFLSMVKYLETRLDKKILVIYISVIFDLWKLFFLLFMNFKAQLTKCHTETAFSDWTGQMVCRPACWRSIYKKWTGKTYYTSCFIASPCRWRLSCWYSWI